MLHFQSNHLFQLDYNSLELFFAKVYFPVSEKSRFQLYNLESRCLQSITFQKSVDLMPKSLKQANNDLTSMAKEKKKKSSTKLLSAISLVKSHETKEGSQLSTFVGNILYILVQVKKKWFFSFV